MRLARGVLGFLAVVLAHWFLATYLPLWGLSPQLPVLATVALASYEGPVAGQCAGFLWGLFLDCLSAHVFGAGPLALTLVGYWAGRLRRQVDVSGAAYQTMAGAAACAAYFLIFGFSGLVFERRFLWVGAKTFFGASLYGALAAPLVFWAARRCLK